MDESKSLGFVRITDKAQGEVRKLIARENKQGLSLRLGVKGGGCSGLSYDVRFTMQEDGDTEMNYGDFRVVIDPKSMIYLKGMQLDYQDGLQGHGFTFSNPNASSTCGCGESFSIT